MQLGDVDFYIYIVKNHKSQCLSGLNSLYSVQHPLSLDAQCEVREKQNLLAGKNGKNLSKSHRISFSINRTTNSQKIQIPTTRPPLQRGSLEENRTLKIINEGKNIRIIADFHNKSIVT